MTHEEVARQSNSAFFSGLPARFLCKARSPKRAFAFLVVQFSLSGQSAISFAIHGHSSASEDVGDCLYPRTIVLGTQCSVFTSNCMIP